MSNDSGASVNEHPYAAALPAKMVARLNKAQLAEYKRWHPDVPTPGTPAAQVIDRYDDEPQLEYQEPEPGPDPVAEATPRKRFNSQLTINQTIERPLERRERVLAGTMRSMDRPAYLSPPERVVSTPAPQGRVDATRRGAQPTKSDLAARSSDVEAARQATPAARSSDAKAARQEPATCKPRPEDTTPKSGGGGQSRPFVPWCERKR